MGSTCRRRLPQGKCKRSSRLRLLGAWCWAGDSIGCDSQCRTKVHVVQFCWMCAGFRGPWEHQPCLLRGTCSASLCPLVCVWCTALLSILRAGCQWVPSSSRNTAGCPVGCRLQRHCWVTPPWRLRLLGSWMDSSWHAVRTDDRGTEWRLLIVSTLSLVCLSWCMACPTHQSLARSRDSDVSLSSTSQ
jgi:hypothetical protein